MRIMDWELGFSASAQKLERVPLKLLLRAAHEMVVDGFLDGASAGGGGGGGCAPGNGAG